MAYQRKSRSQSGLPAPFWGIAVLLLFLGYVSIRGHLDDSVAALTGIQASFLDGWVVLLLIFGGAAVGAIGSAVSVRRYLAV